MKKILIFLFTIILFSSCEDYLTVESPSKFSRTYVFSTEEEIFSAVTGIYVPMVGSRGWVGQLSQYMFFGTDVEIGNKIATSTSNLSETAFVPNSSNNSAYDNIWEKLYDGINRANDVIEGIEECDLYASTDTSETCNMTHYLGSAYVLRAMYYLELVCDFGDVPYRREPAGDKDELYIGATDRDSILTDMINDCINVEPRLFYASESETGCEGVSREFCQGLIARMALIRGGYKLRPDTVNTSNIGTMERTDDWKEYYQIAEKYAGKVIDEGKHSLSRSFKEVWVDECNWEVPTDDDNIFDVPAKVGGTGEYGYFHGTYIVGETNSSGTKSSNATQGYSQGALKLNLSYMASFDDNDLRRDITCELFRYKNVDGSSTKIYQEPVSLLYVYCGKWNKLFMEDGLGSTSSKGTGINYCYMRYADILLMYAEAANENNNGPTEAAKEALKTVRERAFDSEYQSTMVDDYVDNLTTKDEFFDAIVKERAWEFGGEKLRRNDLARWNLYGETLYNLYHNWITMGKVAWTNYYKDTSTPFDEGAASGTDFDDYPAVAYYKLVDAEDPVDDCVSQEAEWYTDDDGTCSYDACIDYSDGTPSGYTKINMFTKYITISGSYPSRTWEPASMVSFVFYGYINSTNAESVDPENDPVRYIAPIPDDAISSHQGLLQNYYGY